MRHFIIIQFLIILNSCLYGQSGKRPILSGPYLGQSSPGNTPEIFAPGVVSRPGYFEHSAALFTPDGKEVYWTAKANDQRDYRIYSMKMVNGIWSRPDVASFCREGKYYQNCILSSDGKRLYFTDGNSWQMGPRVSFLSVSGRKTGHGPKKKSYPSPGVASRLFLLMANTFSS